MKSLSLHLDHHVILAGFIYVIVCEVLDWIGRALQFVCCTHPNTLYLRLNSNMYIHAIAESYRMSTLMIGSTDGREPILSPAAAREYCFKVVFFNTLIQQGVLLFYFMYISCIIMPPNPLYKKYRYICDNFYQLSWQMEWSTIVCGLVNIPMSIFPEVKDTRWECFQWFWWCIVYTFKSFRRSYHVIMPKAKSIRSGSQFLCTTFF